MTDIAVTKDALLNQVAPTTNYGSVIYVTVSSSAYLIAAFDISSIPAGATIVSAECRLQADFGTTNDFENLLTERITQAWAEASVTWNEYTTGRSWATPGGDIAPAEQSVSALPASLPATLAFDVSQHLEAVLGDSTLNLRFRVDGFSALTIATKENGTTAKHPKMVVEYTTGPNVAAVRQHLEGQLCF